ncbi:MAG: hypothetical protein ABS904_00715 [Solibacillus isronensis]
MSKYVVLRPSDNAVLPVTIPNMNDSTIVTKLFNKQLTGLLADLVKFFEKWDDKDLTESYIITYNDENGVHKYIEGYTCSDLKAEMSLIPDLSLCNIYLKDCVSGRTSLPDYPLINLATEFHSIINLLSLSDTQPAEPLTMDLLLERSMSQLYYSKYLSNVTHEQMMELLDMIKINLTLYSDKITKIVDANFVQSLSEMHNQFGELFTKDYCNSKRLMNYEEAYLSVLEELFNRAKTGKSNSYMPITAIKEVLMLVSIIIYNKVNKEQQPFAS